MCKEAVLSPVVVCLLEDLKALECHVKVGGVEGEHGMSCAEYEWTVERGDVHVKGAGSVQYFFKKLLKFITQHE